MKIEKISKKTNVKQARQKYDFFLVKCEQLWKYNFWSKRRLLYIVPQNIVSKYVLCYKKFNIGRPRKKSKMDESIYFDILQ